MDSKKVLKKLLKLAKEYREIEKKAGRDIDLARYSDVFGESLFGELPGGALVTTLEYLLKTVTEDEADSSSKPSPPGR